MNVEVDRLSSLSDDLIDKILSSVDIRDVIQFSVLSSRWRYIWTSVRCLNFTCYNTEIFSQLVNNVLSRRKNIDVASIKLIGQYGLAKQEFLKNILDYAFAHNVQRMKITCSERKHSFPISLLSSECLKTFTLTETRINGVYHLPTSAWDLQALTTLHLEYVNLESCDFIIGMCQNLKSLSLNRCEVTNSQEDFSITNSQLLSLTLKNVKWWVKSVHVDTPQLKTLIVKNNEKELMISAPNLTYLLLNGSYHPIQLSAEGFRSLEKVDLCLNFPEGRKMNKNNAREIYNLLQHLHNVKCLALNLEMVEILSETVKVISPPSSPFASLESLKIYPAHQYGPTKIIMNIKVKNYLLESSPNAIITIVSREEIITRENTKEAKRVMAAFKVQLENMKSTVMETNKAHMEREETQVEQQLPFWKTTSNSRWGDLKQQISATDNIMLEVHHIKKQLHKVLESERDEIQACYSSLCAEAETIVNKLMDDMKTQIDIKQSLVSGYFSGFASMSRSSS